MNDGTTNNYRTIDGSKQALVKDLENAVADADALIGNAASATADEIALARSKIETRLRQARNRLHDAGLVVGERARVTVDATDKYVTDHPWKVLGVAAAAGIVIGALLSRR